MANVNKQRRLFRKVSKLASDVTGSPGAFLAALGLVVGWFISGFVYEWSEQHSFFINNTTTIITFLMTFLIQSSQNRDSVAVQRKLDELILTQKGARNSLLALEEAEDEQCDVLKEEFNKLRKEDAE